MPTFTEPDGQSEELAVTFTSTQKTPCHDARRTPRGLFFRLIGQFTSDLTMSKPRVRERSGEWKVI